MYNQCKTFKGISNAMSILNLNAILRIGQFLESIGWRFNCRGRILSSITVCSILIACGKSLFKGSGELIRFIFLVIKKINVNHGSEGKSPDSLHNF